MSQAITRDLTSRTLPTATFRPAPADLRYGNAAMFASLLCVLGMLGLLVAELGWWSLLAGPVYLSGLLTALMVTRGRTHSLLAVGLATASMAALLGLAQLIG